MIKHIKKNHDHLPKIVDRHVVPLVDDNLCGPTVSFLFVMRLHAAKFTNSARER